MSEKTSVLKNRVVLLLGLVSFFADVSSEMLYPITPIFLTTVLGASMSSVGLIEGAGEAVASLLKTFSGFYSDRSRKRKPFIFGGYLLSAIGKPVIGFASGWGLVLFARSLDRTGKGIRASARDALLSEAVDDSQRGAAFGWHRAMDTAGAAVGPLLALLFLTLEPQNLRAIFYLAFIPGLLSALTVLLVPEKSQTQQFQTPPPRFEFKKLPKNFYHYIFSWGVFSLANSSDVFLLLKVKSAGISTTRMILMYCAYNLVYAFFSPILGKLSDTRGRKTILAFGLLVFAGVYAVFSIAEQEWVFWLLFLVYGLYMAATDGVGKAFALDLVPKNLKATCVGLLGTVTGITALFASLIAGVLWDHFGSAVPLLYGAFGAIIGAVLVLTINEKSGYKAAL